MPVTRRLDFPDTPDGRMLTTIIHRLLEGRQNNAPIEIHYLEPPVQLSFEYGNPGYDFKRLVQEPSVLYLVGKIRYPSVGGVLLVSAANASTFRGHQLRAVHANNKRLTLPILTI